VSEQEVDAYLAALEEPKRQTLEELRRTILQIVPDAEQCTTYGTPTFKVDGRAVAGFAAFWKVADEMHINNLAVHPDCRGRGLGRRLLAGALAAAYAMGIRRATLEVRRSNVVAQQLYAGAGFRVVGVRGDYYTHPVEDALVLSAALVETTGEGW